MNKEQSIQQDTVWKDLEVSGDKNTAKTKYTPASHQVNNEHTAECGVPQLLIHHGQFSIERLLTPNPSRPVFNRISLSMVRSKKSHNLKRQETPSKSLRHVLWNSQTCDLTSISELSALCRKHA